MRQTPGSGREPVDDRRGGPRHTGGRWAGLLKGYLAETKRNRRRGIVVSHDLKLERLFDASPEVVFAAARVTDRL